MPFCSANAVPVVLRPELTSLASSRLLDRSSIVRRRAVALLSAFLHSHPFCLDGGELRASLLSARLAQVEAALSSSAAIGGEDDDVGERDGNVATLLLQKRYYEDALVFVRQLDAAIAIVESLLHAKGATKSEACDAMDLLVEAHIYQIETGQVSTPLFCFQQEPVRRMMHLIHWQGDSAAAEDEEDKTSKRSVREHLLDCFRRVYLSASDGTRPLREQAVEVASNLARLVGNRPSVAECTSLQQVFAGLHRRAPIADAVLHALLFQLLAQPGTARQAAIVIALLAPSMPVEMLGDERRVEAMLRFGLRHDCPVVSLHCIRALCSLPVGRLPCDHPLLTRLHSFVVECCTDPRWYAHPLQIVFTFGRYQVITEAIRAFYRLSAHPDRNAAGLIRALSSRISTTGHFSRLLHSVGQVACAQLVHLDTLEATLKAASSKSEKKSVESEDIAARDTDNELLIRRVREQEMLSTGLLAAFTPLIIEACKTGVDQHLQLTAASAMARFALISFDACRRLLPMIMHLMRGSSSYKIRANAVVAVADLIRCYGQQLSSDSSFDLSGHLFACLSDGHADVRRNALLAITHLSRTGMIKVRGSAVAALARLVACNSAATANEREGGEQARISALARLFFTELADKDGNAVYNLLPDIIACHGGSNSEEDAKAMWADERQFEAAMRFVFGFVKKVHSVSLYTTATPVFCELPPIGTPVGVACRQAHGPLQTHCHEQRCRR